MGISADVLFLPAAVVDKVSEKLKGWLGTKLIWSWHVQVIDETNQCSLPRWSPFSLHTFL